MPISARVVGKYYANRKLSSILNNPSANNMAYDPGAGSYTTVAASTTPGIIAATSGTANTSQFDTDTSKPGASFNASVSEKKGLQLQVWSTEMKPIMSSGRRVWAMLTDEATKKLYFFTGPFSSGATPYSMSQDFYVEYVEREQLADADEFEGLPPMSEAPNASIGVGSINASDMFGTGVVDAAAIGADAVGSSEIDDASVAAVDLAFAPQIFEGSRTGQTTDTLSPACATGMEKSVQITAGEGQKYINRTGGTNNANNTFSVSGATITYGAAQPNDSVSLYGEYLG